MTRLLTIIALLFATPVWALPQVACALFDERSGKPIVFDSGRAFDGIDEIVILPKVLYFNGDPKIYESMKIEGMLVYSFKDDELAEGASHMLTIKSAKDIELATFIPVGGVLGFFKEPNKTIKSCVGN